MVQVRGWPSLAPRAQKKSARGGILNDAQPPHAPKLVEGDPDLAGELASLSKG